MKISFDPSADTKVIINALLDIFERRDTSSARAIKVKLREINLPAYFSQQDPEPRMIANQQLQALANANLIHLHWLKGEENHLLESVGLDTAEERRLLDQSATYHAPFTTPHVPLTTSHASTTLSANVPRLTPHELYSLINRTPISNQRSQLEDLLLADKFRFSADDWRGRALKQILDKLRAGKSPSPFSLSAADFNADLLAALLALSNLQAETPQRVFSVRTFNDTKRFDDLRPALIRLARQANPEWKSLSAEDLLRELNLVANPGYVHLSGNWQLTTIDGEVLSLNGFSPSVGFPAAQISAIQTVSVHADSVLCIENLTSFFEFIRRGDGNRYTGRQVDTSHVPRFDFAQRERPTPHAPRTTPHAVICLMGNPSPAIRRLLRLVPEETNIYLWSDMDYGGFNILSQLRKKVSARVQPFLMDVSTFEKYAQLSRPLTQTDIRNLKRLALQSNLRDMQSVIEHLLKRGLKLEQEAIAN